MQSDIEVLPNYATCAMILLISSMFVCRQMFEDLLQAAGFQCIEVIEDEISRQQSLAPVRIACYVGPVVAGPPA